MVLTGEEKAQRAANVRSRLAAAAASSSSSSSSSAAVQLTSKGVKYDLSDATGPGTSKVQSEYAPVEFKKKKLRKKVKTSATRKVGKAAEAEEDGAEGSSNKSLAFLDEVKPSVGEHQKDHASRSSVSASASSSSKLNTKDIGYLKV
jgi:hypothetical protein